MKPFPLLACLPLVLGLGFSGCGMAHHAVHKTAHAVKHGKLKVENHL